MKMKVVFILCFLGSIIVQVNAAVRCCRFEVKNSAHTRLCNKKTMLTVNGQFPGPTIYARKGDLVTIDIVNRADHHISIHWHGVKMPRYPWSDGTDFVTQCPLSPGERFTQRMILSDEEGTLWWHAHSDWFRTSVYGAIVILPRRNETYPFPKPHAHVPILLGEWWNDDVQQMVDELKDTGGYPKPSNAFLINGQPGDLYPCSKQDSYKLRVEYGKTYLIKLINAVMNNIMFFKIGGHNFTVVGTDGAYTKPFVTDLVAIPPGQTVDLLLEANQPPSHYYMAARIYASGDGFGGNPTTPTTATIEYVGIYMAPPSPLLPNFPIYNDSEAVADFSSKLRSLTDGNVPQCVDKTLFFTLSMNHIPCTQSTCTGPIRQVASINNVTMGHAKGMDILQAYYRGINGLYTADFPDFPPSRFDYTGARKGEVGTFAVSKTAVNELEYGTTVEVVLQATDLVLALEHPMHLHGYSFYVVGSGLGNYNRSRDPDNYNLVDPPLVENVIVPKNGWAAIRFKANNPGAWFMNCHYETHQTWGMNMVFIVKDGEAPDEKMLPPPPDMPLC